MASTMSQPHSFTALVPCHDMTPINVLNEWRDGEPDLMLDQTIWPTSFDLSCQLWSMLAEPIPDRAGSIQYAANLHKWQIVLSGRCPDDEPHCAISGMPVDQTC